MATVLLLLASNVFMTVAWYWHLKGGMTKPLLVVVLISWGIAFFEYCLAVPANRLGYAHGFTAGQLKVTQEVVTLIVFAGVAWAMLGEAPGWRHLGAFACLIGAVAFMFVGAKGPSG